jgi:DNA-binding HxlR family transcriptional regulator
MSSIIEPVSAILPSMLGKDYDRQDCSLARALEVIGERWTLLVVRDALYGVRRFNDFQEHLDVPKAVLADRLRGLVEEGILERRPDAAHRGRHLYELTAAGRDLWPVVHALLAWGDAHRGPGSRIFRHAPCGTALDAAGACPTCGVTPAAGAVVSERRRRRAPLRDDPVSRVLRAPRPLLEPLET